MISTLKQLKENIETVGKNEKLKKYQMDIINGKMKY